MPKEYSPKAEEMRAFWISALTPDVVKYTSYYMFKSNINKALKIMKDNNMNTLIYHIRPTNYAFYPSELNPWSKYFSGKYSDTENTFSPPT